MYAGPSAAQQAAEATTYLNLDALPLGQVFLDTTQSWSAGMWSSYYIATISSAAKAMVTVPMLIGSGTAQSGQTTSPQAADGVTNTPTTMTLAAVAAGTWDTCFTNTFQTIATARPDAILRLGWEHYGNWYPWGGAAQATAHKNAWIHLVDLARDISPSFEFDWNGAATYAGYDATTSYPGDTYVDYISVDVYDTYSPWGQTGWDVGAVNFITQGYEFALAHAKPFCIPEYGFYPTAGGVGGGDDPAWIEAAFNWIEDHASDMGYAMFFDSNSSNQSAFAINPTGGAALAPLLAKAAARSAARLAGQRMVGTGSHSRL